MNKQHQVVKVIAIFSGALDFTEANNKAFYRLATPGKHGSYTAKNAGIIHLKKAVYTGAKRQCHSDADQAVYPEKAGPASHRRSGPSGLQDSLGRYLDAAEPRPGREQRHRDPLQEQRDH